MPRVLILSTAVAALLLAGAGLPATAQDADPSVEPDISTAPAETGAAAEAAESPDANAAIEEAKPDESAIRTALEVEGYSEIRNLRKEGGYYLADAQRFGETVGVKVDATTRLVVEPTRLTRAQIQNKLEQEGYQGVRGLGRTGDVGVFNAEAEKDGQMVSLQIDPVTGNVMLERGAGQ